MLKSTLSSPFERPSKRPTLPHLFRCKGTDGVVLFFGETAGTCVAAFRGTKLGETLGHGASSPKWISCWDTDHWTPLLPGESITITVESED